jgi:hypothetical protein
MPVPVKVRVPRPATPAVAPLPDTRRQPTAMDPGPADVVRARTLVGNAAITAAMDGLPPGPDPNPAGWRGQMLLAGQNLVGNQAVATQAVAPAVHPVRKPPARPQALTKATAPPVPKPDQKDTAPKDRQDKGAAKKEPTGPRSPGTDPKFQALKKDVTAKKRAVGESHPPATAEAGAAQAASVPPADDREARGKAAHAEDMDAAQPKEFTKSEFVAAVQDAIAKRAPKNLDEADKFGDSGKADEVKAEVQGKVGEGKEASAKEIADTTAAAPQPAPDAKEVVPLAPDKVPGKPGAPNPNQAVPDPLPASAMDMSAGPAQVDQQMSDAQVTEPQLTKSNEPTFTKAVKDKKTLEAHSATAPAHLRAGEADELKRVKNTADAKGTTTMAGLHATRVATGQQVGKGKTGTKTSDEDKRTQVTALLQKVFDQTKCDVEKILSDLDKKVDDQFTTEEKRARDRFTAEHTEGMNRYKHERYSGFWGKARWVKDLFADLPEEANRIYERAKDNYLTAMRQVISNIADTIDRELRHAKDRIAAGRKELTDAVDKLPADLRALGREAATDFESKFDELKDTVNDKGTELVDTLATKYTDAVKSVDDEIAAEKEKNKGLVSKAADAIAGIIRTIKELGSLLMGVLRKAVSAIGAILKDPIGFLGNLVTGVGGGLKLFMKNAGRHLEQGVLAWLLGTAATAGIQLPTSFDILGILLMITTLLGLSWANLRARLVRKVPEKAVAAAETAVPLVMEVRKRGVAGMWSDLKTRVGDLKKDLISNLVSFLLPTIIIAGITWIVSLFNPASAFIRACKMIIDIIRFIVTNGRQIIEFVNTVLDAVIAIAKGGSGGVPALVEKSLAKSIPVLIGALAALLGVGGIAGKVKQIFQKLARPVNKAIDWVVTKIVGLVKKLWAKLKSRKTKKPRKPTDGKDDRVDNLDWHIREIRPKAIKKTFAMTSGEGHSLTADAGESRLEFRIASKFAGEVRAVFADLRREAKEIPNPEDRAAALRELDEIKKTLDDIRDAEKDWKKKSKQAHKTVMDRVNRRKKTTNARKRIKTQADADRLKEQWITEEEHRLYRDLEKVLADQIKALSRLKGMEQFNKKPGVRMLPRGYDVRERLYNYGSGWKSKSKSWRERQKKDLVNKVKDILAKGHTPQAKAKLEPLDKALHQLPRTWSARFDRSQFTAGDVSKTSHQVDHAIPLASHWIQAGHNTGDKPRRDHNVDESKWRLVTQAYNASRGAEGAQFGDQQELEDKFTSELADGGIRNAKRIDGKPLLDKDGKPIK